MARRPEVIAAIAAAAVASSAVLLLIGSGTAEPDVGGPIVLDGGSTGRLPDPDRPLQTVAPDPDLVRNEGAREGPRDVSGRAGIGQDRATDGDDDESSRDPTVERRELDAVAEDDRDRDGGADDGGAEDDRDRNGGAKDGGAKDGGAEDDRDRNGGAKDGGAKDGGAEDDRDRDGGAEEDDDD